MKRAYSALLLAALLMLSIELPMQTVRIAKANPFTTPPNTVWKINYPENYSTYDTRSMSLNFNIETNYGLLYFYSLDGQEKTAFNTLVILQEPLPSVDYVQTPDGSPLYRKTLQASISLFNMENGNHTLTIYQVYPFSPERPQDGAVISHATLFFNISSNLPMETSIPTASPAVSPSPIIPSPTVISSPTPNPSVSSLISPSSAGESYSSLLIAEITTIAIALAGTVILLFRRRRKTANLARDNV